tara:strand:+ start:4289 stop:4711 length:423 start_codon:yes stop_codon:yes gene_type:complete
MNNILIVSSRFYEEISKDLEKEAVEVLVNNNYQYDIISVPGAFEVPSVISQASKSNKYKGYIALGCVIRGETSHYDYVCNESARALMNLSLEGVPIGYGILTCETKEQAIIRSKPNGLNKGKAAALACIGIVDILTELKK